jgi:GTP-binding protein
MNIEFLALAQSPDSLPKPSVPEVAFVGRSNSGKSSLINTLVGQKIARTSSTPGRTQGLCFFKIKPNLIFVDFPGYGYAKISKSEREAWVPLAEKYYDTRRTLRATIWIYDIRRDPDPLDFQMKGWLMSKGKPYILVMTKCDQLTRSEWKSRQSVIIDALEISKENSLIFSSKTKEGVKTLWRMIEHN